MSSKATAPRSALAWAEEAHALVRAHPRKALALAERALAAALVDGDSTAQVAAANALGWAQSVLGDTDQATKTWRAGIRRAERQRDPRGTGVLRRQLAVSLAFAGKTQAAQREMDTALSLLAGPDRAHAQVHRVAVHTRARTPDPDVHRRVLADAARALRAFRRDGDEIWEARLLYNLGLLRADRGEFEQARASLEQAHALYARCGAPAAAVDARVKLAEIELLQGEVIGCLRTIEEIQAQLPPDEPNFNLEECRMMALTQSRLLPEARAAATAYAEHCARSGRTDGVASTKLDLSAIALASGDHDAARGYAASAARSFTASHKPMDAALARSAVLRAQLAAGSVGRRSVSDALEAAAVLEGAGWRRDALRTRLLAARIALATASKATARQQLELVRPLGARGTVTDRIDLLHARGLSLAAEGKTAAAERLFEQGLRLLDEYRSALGAVELRAAASGIGSELARDGLRIALARGRPEAVLSWAERLRASALRQPIVRPAADAALRSLQTDLRQAIAKNALGRQARLESAIRARSRIVEADSAERAERLDTETTERLLGNRALIEYIQLDGLLHALTLAKGRLDLHHLGAATATGELDWLRFAYGRLAAGSLTTEHRRATLANAEASAAALEALLVEPIAEAVGDAPLVVVPTGALHAVPWGGLRALRGRPVAVAPSLATWSAHAARPRSRRRKAAFIAGPRLRHAGAEVRELGALRPDATVLHGRAATAEATLKALDGAALAHLACHGHFRADSPLFSSLELADGRLNVYELQQLTHAPELVVLSACDLALSTLHPGDELLGFAAALLGMGTRTIVASVVPVPDAPARRLMLAFHTELRAGAAPATALARAQQGAKTPGFICLGAG